VFVRPRAFYETPLPANQIRLHVGVAGTLQSPLPQGATAARSGLHRRADHDTLRETRATVSHDC